MITVQRARGLLAVGMVVAVGALAAARGTGTTQLTEPFKGITRDGTTVRGLFPVRATGVSTAGVHKAAIAFLDALSPEQRSATSFTVDHEEWRDWQNIHRYARKGVNFKSMSESQRDRAFTLLTASLSARGLEKMRNIMRLNHHLAELRQNFDEYGEGLYHLTVMGTPSATDPWGWQLDGHHLVINYFILRDQVVMTPTFMGSEPVVAESGQYKGTAVLQDEQNKGLALMTALTPDQRKRATIDVAKTGNNAVTQAFRDNVVLDHAGIKATELDEKHQALLLELVGEYVHNMDGGHAKVRMDEVRAHLNDTHFAWIGELGPETVFYYRIHSPVILIEFDHQLPVGIQGLPKVPNRRHIHTVVRTPNGNDYGKDLLRQHHETQRH
jgi:Protein of unknown function (DUF3500)